MPRFFVILRSLVHNPSTDTNSDPHLYVDTSTCYDTNPQPCSKPSTDNGTTPKPNPDLEPNPNLKPNPNPGTNRKSNPSSNPNSKSSPNPNPSFYPQIEP